MKHPEGYPESTPTRRVAIRKAGTRAGTIHVMSAAIHRSKQRRSGYLFRLSAEDREELRRRAEAHGLSVQLYLEVVALGRENPQERRPGPTRSEETELFSMTG